MDLVQVLIEHELVNSSDDDVLGRPGIQVGTDEVRRAEVEEERAADTTEHPKRSGHGFDQREPQLDVGEQRGVTDELQIVVSAHFIVSTEEREVREVSPTLESPRAEGEDAVFTEPEIASTVHLEGLP